MAHLRLNFYVLDQQRKMCFAVSVAPNSLIQDLVVNIQTVYRRMTGRTIRDLDLFECNQPKVGNMSEACPDSSPLEFTDEVSTIWSGSVDPKLIHIYIKPNYESNSELGDEGPARGMNDLSAERTAKIEKVQSQVLNALTSKNSSTLAKPSNFYNYQKTPHAIHNGRPRHQVEPPIHLFHPVFDAFLAGLGPAQAVPVEKPNDTLRLLEQSQAQYKTELTDQGRNQAIVSVLDKLLDTTFMVREVAGVKADGTISAVEGGICLVMEAKNEIGQGGWDPSVQGAISYAKYWGAHPLTKIRLACCCPSSILAVAGPWMCVLGAIMLERPIIQPLTDFLWVGSSCQPRTQSNDHALARVFTSLSSSILSLRNFYDTLPSKRNTHRFDPYRRREEDIVIKYAESYHVEAHRLLAQAGLAPKLLFMSSEGKNGYKVGSRSMIVMERVGGDSFPLPSGILAPPCVKGCISRALELLHQEGIVFGDLRHPNVMTVLDDQKNITGAMLVDFDWCGQDDEATYPTDINTEIDWPAGVGPGTVMKREHDLEMFQKMFPS